jgi:hypothetical protein
MTITRLAETWNEWAETHNWDEDSVTEFCNTYAESLEEYYSMHTLLVAAVCE